MEPLVVGVQYAFHGLRGFDRERALFNDDFIARGTSHNLAGCFFPILKVRGTAGPLPEHFSGRVDGHEDDVRVRNAFVDVRAEEEIFIAAGEDNVVEAGFVYGKTV